MMNGFRVISGYVGLGVKQTSKYMSNKVFRLIQFLRVFFHAVGLGILTVVGRQEPPKILIYTSRRQAVFHSVTHILPVFVSITLIAFNLQGFFIGRELQGEQGLDGLKLGVIQIAAKVQVSVSA